MNEFNDTPARKQIGYWVSEQGRCMKWFYLMKMCAADSGDNALPYVFLLYKLIKLLYWEN